MSRDHREKRLPSRLETYLATIEDRPFEWGVNDCRTLVQGWLAVVGGYEDVIAEGNKAMEECRTAADFIRLMRERELEINPEFLRGRVGSELRLAHQCEEGDIAVFPLPNNKGYRLGIVDAEGAVVGLTKDGLVRERSNSAVGARME